MIACCETCCLRRPTGDPDNCAVNQALSDLAREAKLLIDIVCPCYRRASAQQPFPNLRILTVQ